MFEFILHFIGAVAVFTTVAFLVVKVLEWLGIVKW